MRPHVHKSVKTEKKKNSTPSDRKWDHNTGCAGSYRSIRLTHRWRLCCLIHTNPDSPVLLVHMLFTPRVPRLRADYNMPRFGEERLYVSHRHTHTFPFMFHSNPVSSLLLISHMASRNLLPWASSIVLVNELVGGGSLFLLFLNMTAEPGANPAVTCVTS